MTTNNNANTVAITPEDIPIQTMLVDEIQKNPTIDSFELYNKIANQINVPSFLSVQKIITMIEQNKRVINT